MPRSTVRRRDGGLVGELPSVAENPPFVPRDELLKVGEGQGFYAAVVRPRNFDNGRFALYFQKHLGRPEGR